MTRVGSPGRPPTPPGPAAGRPGGCSGGAGLVHGRLAPRCPAERRAVRRAEGRRHPRPPSAADWAALAAGLDGSLVRPDSAGFAAAHELYDPRWDSVKPAAVVRAAGAADVAEAISFARRHGVPLVARGGGHSYLGASSIADGARGGHASHRVSELRRGVRHCDHRRGCAADRRLHRAGRSWPRPGGGHLPHRRAGWIGPGRWLRSLRPGPWADLRRNRRDAGGDCGRGNQNR